MDPISQYIKQTRWTFYSSVDVCKIPAMKWFIFLLVVNIVAAWFIFLLVVHIVATSPTPEVMESITDRKILRNIPNHMSEEYSACGNYFEYACAKYAERHINESYSNDRQMLEKRVLEDLRELMEELHISSGMAGFNESSCVRAPSPAINCCILLSLCGCCDCGNEADKRRRRLVYYTAKNEKNFEYMSPTYMRPVGLCGIRS